MTATTTPDPRAAADPAPLDAGIAARVGAIWSAWWPRLALLLAAAAAIGVVWSTNLVLTQRYTEIFRTRADARATLYVGALVAELQRNSIVPQLLARDPDLIAALKTRDYSRTTLRLNFLAREIGAASLTLHEADGRVVAATDRRRLGEMLPGQPAITQALRSDGTVFTQADGADGLLDFAYSRRVAEGGSTLGVVVVGVDLLKFERDWLRAQDAVMVTDSTGHILLSTERRWRGQTEEAALDTASPRTAIERALAATQRFALPSADAYLDGQAVMRREVRVPFQGWKLITFSAHTSVRNQVNGVLALEIMGFAILLAVGFWLSSRRTARSLFSSQRESAELRALADRLSREIAAREEAERTLVVAEQTLAQSSKLAVLGEMSASVSHELNQPLAAMKTYLAGARILVQRRRTDEALASFQRVDDLIDRMGAITRQLKSYARKGEEAFEPFDVRDALSSALAMMEPQLRSRRVAIDRVVPDAPALVVGDRLRLEQVIVNLLRNALDAVKSVPSPSVAVLLVSGETITLTVRDNGPGIADPDALFEPFYTTKAPGEGVGLGLAISSGIVSDLGGRLTARNGPRGGAVFEVVLPRMAPATLAAAE